MGLNIKNERVHALAREAARRTGKTQTAVIEEALDRLLGDLDRSQDSSPRLAALMAGATELQKRLELSGGGPLTVDDLYDDEGLPR